MDANEYFYHYYERRRGPFLNLSHLSIEAAQAVLNRLKTHNKVMAAHRYDGYLERRKELEQIARRIFIAKGGHPFTTAPHYMVIGPCDWLHTWYEEGEYVRMPVSAFHLAAVSFSYGDLFPTFSLRVTDNKEYRKNVYTWEEIQELIAKYGLPQEWNRDGVHGPERYIEVQVWDDEPMQEYLRGGGKEVKRLRRAEGQKSRTRCHDFHSGSSP